MDKLNAIDVEFKELLSAEIERFEKRFDRHKQLQEKHVRRNREKEKKLRDIITSSQIDLRQIDGFFRDEEKELERELEQVRKEFINRPATVSEKVREHRLFESLVGTSCSQQFQPYASIVFATDNELLKHIEGKRSNPWVMPDKPGELNIKLPLSGSGSGCWFSCGMIPTYQYDLWYYFEPTQSATYFLTPLVDFHGFYIMKANDGFFSCKHSYVWLQLKMNTFQYFWHGVKSFDLIKEHRTNSSESEFYDETPLYTYTTSLKAGDPVWFKLSIWFWVCAKGGGSYAELNFLEGGANFIQPRHLVVSRFPVLLPALPVDQVVVI
jgi:hypothetical protein